jgi:hypothetical protein
MFFHVCFLVLYVCFLFCVFCVLVLFLCIVSLVVHPCLFPIFVQVYGPLPPGGNYHIISILTVFVSIDAYICHMSYFFVLVLSRIGNIWVWCLGGIPRSLPFLIQENSSRLKSLNPSNTLLIPILMLTTLFVVQC